MAMVIYDNGGKTADRYTVFPYAHSRLVTERRTYLGCSEGGLSYSEWGELPANCPRGHHLGKTVPFDQLSEETQAHITRRIKET